MDYPKIPNNPNFSSGPCSKFNGWSINNLGNSFLGRSHRSKEGKLRLKNAINETGILLKLPKDYILGIVPGSDTGALEIALWNILGQRGVDVLAWDSFGSDWVNDIVHQLSLSNSRVLNAEYGFISNLNSVNFSNDVVFTWNGTTSGVCIPNADWIDKYREGLTICDATSAVFAMNINWEKIDVASFSWQKALGGEAAHGMLVLSPRAIKRINEYTPKWPVPKLFNLKKKGKLDLGIFEGLTINTPSMLAVEEWINIIKWANSKGGLNFLKEKTKENFSIVSKFCEENDWIDFLAEDKLTRSSTSVCLKIIDPWFSSLNEFEQNKFINTLVKDLEDRRVAFDIKSYRTAPLGLRIWCGPTIEKNDLICLMEWLNYSWQSIGRK